MESRGRSFAVDVTIKPTYRCNFACSYCCIHQFGRSPLPELSADDAIRVLERVCGRDPSCEKVLVKWHGGEPLVLGRDYFEHVFEWQDSQSRVFDNAVFTNLTLMDDDLAELFAEHDAHIYTSLDTTFPEHDVQRGGRCAEVCQHLERLRELGFSKVTVKSTVTAKTVCDLPAVNEFMKTLPFEWNFGPVFPSGRGSKDYLSIMPNPAEFTHIAQGIFDDWVVTNGTRVYLFDQVLDELLNPCDPASVCRPMFNVDPFGDVYFCAQFHGDPAYRIGHFDDEDTADRFAARTCEWSSFHFEPCDSCRYSRLCRFNHCSFLGDNLGLQDISCTQYLCEMFRPLFDHISAALVEQIDDARVASSPLSTASTNPPDALEHTTRR